jgi:hypothetical protein
MRWRQEDRRGSGTVICRPLSCASWSWTRIPCRARKWPACARPCCGGPGRARYQAPDTLKNRNPSHAAHKTSSSEPITYGDVQPPLSSYTFFTTLVHINACVDVHAVGGGGCSPLIHWDAVVHLFRIFWFTPAVSPVSTLRAACL